MHIPKNAGTSFRKMIEGELLRDVKYINHDRSGQNLSGDNMYVLRDPFDRFSSAFQYITQYYVAHKINVANIVSPNELAEKLGDGCKIAWDAISDNHTIDNVPCNYNWVFVPQWNWFYDPRHILFYDTLNSDFSKFLSSIGHYPIELEECNKSNKIEVEYSEKAKDFIQNFYKEDFDIIREFRIK